MDMLFQKKGHNRLSQLCPANNFPRTPTAVSTQVSLLTNEDLRLRIETPPLQTEFALRTDSQAFISLTPFESQSQDIQNETRLVSSSLSSYFTVQYSIESPNTPSLVPLVPQLQAAAQSIPVLQYSNDRPEAKYQREDSVVVSKPIL
ncbi:hypothetical protein GcM3_048036 [Golovinomyces cichoracearum]|uniref:Uncharacterized protein n=1 Tax=Golovinomyces cichoracearum TaxID=62708 RepID=A0A420J0B1_9PEZI|nr:hypothetical protein GcM3_048036 [Golovinomyces cichoracearum]